MYHSVFRPTICRRTSLVMMMKLLPVLIMFTLITVSLQQPPGVPPRQQPAHGQPHQQQQQQPQGRQDHGQPQQQQPPQGNHGHHEQQQQQPQGGHDHGHHGMSLEFASEVHNPDHILEHLERVVATKPKDQMTPEELEFHYFKLHDYDNNNQLDGVEIGKALTHSHAGDHNNTASSAPDVGPVLSDEDLAKTVDGILDTFDQDKNGYVEYFEFKRMTQQTAASGQQGNA